MPRPLRVPAVPHYLALIRAGLGLTQAQLAGVLGVSRPLITQIEAGHRTLPAAAGEVLAWLVQGLPPAIPPALLPPSALAPTDPAPLRARAAAVAYELGRLSQQLDRGQARARRALDWLRAVPKLLAMLPTTGSEGPRLWVAAMTAEAEAALEGEGSAARHRLLEARLAGLRAEAAVLAGQLAEPAG